MRYLRAPIAQEFGNYWKQPPANVHLEAQQAGPRASQSAAAPLIKEADKEEQKAAQSAAAKAAPEGLA